MTHHDEMMSIYKTVTHHAEMMSIYKTVTHHAEMMSIYKTVTHHAEIMSIYKTVTHHAEMMSIYKKKIIFFYSCKQVSSKLCWYKIYDCTLLLYCIFSTFLKNVTMNTLSIISIVFFMNIFNVGQLTLLLIGFG